MWEWKVALRDGAGCQGRKCLMCTKMDKRGKADRVELAEAQTSP
jgi:hypothetical protein